MIESPGDAIVIVPLLKEFVNSSLKNDEVLMKILALFQKAEEKKKDASTDTSELLSEKELQQLFSEVTEYKVKGAKQLPEA
jgi:hypothetical protein